MNACAPIARAVCKIDNDCGMDFQPMSHRQDADARIDNTMKKPNVRGPSPSRKAHLALRENLNRKSKPPPSLRSKSLDKARAFDRNEFKQHEQ